MFDPGDLVQLTSLGLKVHQDAIPEDFSNLGKVVTFPNKVGSELYCSVNFEDSNITLHTNVIYVAKHVKRRCGFVQ